MDRVRALFKRPKTAQEYEPLNNDVDGDIQGPGHEVPGLAERAFSRLEYSVFLLLGIAMLWAW